MTEALKLLECPNFSIQCGPSDFSSQPWNVACFSIIKLDIFYGKNVNVIKGGFDSKSKRESMIYNEHSLLFMSQFLHEFVHLPKQHLWKKPNPKPSKSDQLRSSGLKRSIVTVSVSIREGFKKKCYLQLLGRCPPTVGNWKKCVQFRHVLTPP